MFPCRCGCQGWRRVALPSAPVASVQKMLVSLGELGMQSLPWFVPIPTSQQHTETFHYVFKLREFASWATQPPAVSLLFQNGFKHFLLLVHNLNSTAGMTQFCAKPWLGWWFQKKKKLQICIFRFL